MEAALRFAPGEGGIIAHRDGRMWRVQQIAGGYRLAFRDSGDEAWSNAGVHGSFRAAAAEAHRG